MKKEIAEQWVAELRSGKWKQTKGKLRDKSGHCCLGVLCEIAKDKGVENAAQFLEWAHALPPLSVQEWAGMKSSNGRLSQPIENRFVNLDDLNDEGVPFDKIADIIEREAENL